MAVLLEMASRRTADISNIISHSSMACSIWFAVCAAQCLISATTARQTADVSKAMLRCGHTARVSSHSAFRPQLRLSHLLDCLSLNIFQGQIQYLEIDKSSILQKANPKLCFLQQDTACACPEPGIGCKGSGTLSPRRTASWCRSAMWAS